MSKKPRKPNVKETKITEQVKPTPPKDADKIEEKK